MFILGLGETGAFAVPLVPGVPMLRSGSKALGEDTAGVVCAAVCAAGDGIPPGDDGVLFMNPNAEPTNAGGAALAGCCIDQATVEHENTTNAIDVL